MNRAVSVSIAAGVALGQLVLQGAPKKPRLEAVVIEINQTRGVTPAQIKRPKGPFRLVIVDQTQKPGLEIRLLQEAGNQLKAVRLRDFNGDWDEVIDLPPGTYVLSDAVNPKIRCTLTITP